MASNETRTEDAPLERWQGAREGELREAGDALVREILRLRGELERLRAVAGGDDLGSELARMLAAEQR